MIIKTEEKIIKGQKFIYTSTDTLNTFICDCCKKEKKSKKYVESVNKEGLKLTICNACFGTLNAQN